MHVELKSQCFATFLLKPIIHYYRLTKIVSLRNQQSLTWDARRDVNGGVNIWLGVWWFGMEEEPINDWAEEGWRFGESFLGSKSVMSPIGLGDENRAVSLSGAVTSMRGFAGFCWSTLDRKPIIFTRFPKNSPYWPLNSRVVYMIKINNLINKFHKI